MKYSNTLLFSSWVGCVVIIMPCCSIFSSMAWVALWCEGCVFPLSNVPMVLCETDRPTRCHTTWQMLGNGSYYVSRARGSWNTGRTDCLQRGAHLVIVNDRQELVGNTL